MFRAPCAHHQEVKIVLYSIRYRHTYRCDDVEACKTKILCIKLVNYSDKGLFTLNRRIYQFSFIEGIMVMCFF